VPQGPAIARTLRAVEAAWVEAGFPGDTDFVALVDRLLVDGTGERPI